LTEQTLPNTWITINDWTRSLGSAGMDWLVNTVNYLHKTVNLRLRQTAIDIWCVGRVLAKEKELVGHGNWMDHCRRFHPEISVDSIERYMKAGQIPIEQLPALLDKTPRQAYVMLDLARKRSALPVQPVKQDRSKVNSAHMRNSEQGLIIALFECPYCDKKIEFSTEGTYGIARRA
jgi:hypothetical protein